jgi:predicted hotdog family 3-hydroxylacyl-ACP dehydratase
MVMIDTEELITLVPHKGTMFLLSRITSHDPGKHFLATEYDITRNCLFYREELGGAPSWLAFELMAQSISALSGLQNRSRGKAPRFGFILSISALVLHTPVLKEGTTVCIEVEEEAIMDSVYSFRGHAAVEGIHAAEAKLTVMEAEEPDIWNHEAF